MKINTYYSPYLTEDRNFCIENIETFLGDYMSRYVSNVFEIDDFQVGPLDLEMILKIDLDLVNSNAVDKELHPKMNYLKMDLGDINYLYFFITSVDWVADKTLILNLKMDTVNSFYTRVKPYISSRTRILREHRDRFFETTNNTIYRKFWDYNEGINPLLFVNSTEKFVNISNWDRDYYLILKTPTEEEITASQRTVATYFTTETINDVFLNTNDGSFKKSFIANGSEGYYTIDNNHNPTFYLKYSDGTNERTIGLSDIVKLQNETSSDLKLQVIIIEKLPLGHYQIKGYTLDENKNLYLRFDTGEIYLTKLETYNMLAFINSDYSTGYSYDSIINALHIYPLSNQMEKVVKPISMVDRSDFRLMKIIDLPYSPVVWTGTPSFTAEHSYFSQTEHLMFLKPTEKLEYLLSTANDTYSMYANYFSVSLPQSVLTELDRNDYYESKLYNSEFFKWGIKYYENELLISNEKFTNLEGSYPRLRIKYTVANNSTGNFMFTLVPVANTQYKGLTTPFEWSMVVIRDNTLELMTNEYLTYKRTTQQYDYIANNIARMQAIAGADITFGSQATSSQFTLTRYKKRVYSGELGPRGGKRWSLEKHYGRRLAKHELAGGFFGENSGLIGNTLSLAGNIFNTALSLASIENNQKAKEVGLASQQTSIKNGSDIEIMKSQNENRIYFVSYRCSDVIRKIAGDLFYYCGYAIDEQGLPNLDSRYWFNYFEGDLVLERDLSFNPSPIQPVDTYSKAIQEEWLDDFKENFNSGITIFHEHNGEWDLDQTKENFENWIINNH